MRSRRGSTTISFVPRRRACLKNDDATGWFAVVFVPARIATSALTMSPYVVDTAGLAALVGLAADVVRQRALRVAALAADERRGQALRRGRVVPAVAAL